MTFKIDISQLANIKEAMKDLADTVNQKVAIEGTAAMAKVVYDEARLNASRHVKSGKLLGAIYRVYSPERSGDTRKTYRISWNKKKAPHGHLIEFGTSRAPAYPFLRPAASRIPAAIEAGKAALTKALAEEIAKK
jgi:HK97 gp10 family phage protein